MRERNPYLILGIPFGSSREHAQMAFAKRARPLKRQGDAGRDMLTELTWALNQIDDAIVDPDKALHVYRIPADQGAFEGMGFGLFSPAPERLERQQPPSDGALLELKNRAAQELLLAQLRALAGTIAIPGY